MENNNKTMMIDFYEFTMAQTYFDKKEHNKKVYFDIFFRKNPFEGGYTVMGGLDEIINYIKNFKFTDEDIEYLRSSGQFSEEFLKYLKNLKFTGEIFGIPDGTPVFPNEPVLTVRANVIEAQLIETALLACFNHASLVTTAAKRITKAAGGVPVMEFGARRARGIDSAVEASKYAYMGGCSGTSNILAAKKYGIPALGTMAHSLVCDADSEYEAFLDYAKSNPGLIVLIASLLTFILGLILPFSSTATSLYTPPSLSLEAAILSPTPKESKHAPCPFIFNNYIFCLESDFCFFRVGSCKRDDL